MTCRTDLYGFFFNIALFSDSLKKFNSSEVPTTMEVSTLHQHSVEQYTSCGTKIAQETIKFIFLTFRIIWSQALLKFIIAVIRMTKRTWMSAALTVNYLKKKKNN